MKTVALLFLALLPASVLAEVTLYGSINSQFNATQTTLGNGQRHNQSTLGDGGSHIGIRGAIPLGSSTHVIWQTEQEIPLSRDTSSRAYFRHKKENSVFTR